MIGTLALKQPDWFRQMCRKFPGRLVLGSTPATARWPPTAGWRPARCRPSDLARQFAGEPLAAIIYTDIATDGMLSGPNLAAMAEMQRAVELPVIASGGVTTAEDVAGWPSWTGRLHHRPGLVRRHIDA